MLLLLLFQGRVLAATVCGKEIVAFRGADGRAGVLDAFCPHLGTHLGHGTVDALCPQVVLLITFCPHLDAFFPQVVLLTEIISCAHTILGNSMQMASAITFHTAAKTCPNPHVSTPQNTKSESYSTLFTCGIILQTRRRNSK